MRLYKVNVDNFYVIPRTYFEGIFMYGMILGWLDLISLQDMVDGRLLMPHRRKPVMVSLLPRLMKFENEISTAHKN